MWSDNVYLVYSQIQGHEVMILSRSLGRGPLLDYFGGSAAWLLFVKSGD